MQGRMGNVIGTVALGCTCGAGATLPHMAHMISGAGSEDRCVWGGGSLRNGGPGGRPCFSMQGHCRHREGPLERPRRSMAA